MHAAEKMKSIHEEVLRWQHLHHDDVARGNMGNGKGEPNGSSRRSLGRDIVMYGFY